MWHILLKPRSFYLHYICSGDSIPDTQGRLYHPKGMLATTLHWRVAGYMLLPTILFLNRPFFTKCSCLFFQTQICNRDAIVCFSSCDCVLLQSGVCCKCPPYTISKWDVPTILCNTWTVAGRESQCAGSYCMPPAGVVNGQEIAIRMLLYSRCDIKVISDCGCL